jgi:hypothetical protein
MIHLRAKVCRERLESGLNAERTASQRSAPIPIPDWIEIEQGSESGFVLVHIYLREGPFIHTWHATVAEAKDEAQAEFSIGEDEWVAVSPDGSEG